MCRASSGEEKPTFSATKATAICGRYLEPQKKKRATTHVSSPIASQHRHHHQKIHVRPEYPAKRSLSDNRRQFLKQVHEVTSAAGPGVNAVDLLTFGSGALLFEQFEKLEEANVVVTCNHCPGTQSTRHCCVAALVGRCGSDSSLKIPCTIQTGIHTSERSRSRYHVTMFWTKSTSQWLLFTNLQNGR